MVRVACEGECDCIYLKVHAHAVRLVVCCIVRPEMEGPSIAHPE